MRVCLTNLSDELTVLTLSLIGIFFRTASGRRMAVQPYVGLGDVTVMVIAALVFSLILIGLIFAFGTVIGSGPIAF